MRVQFKTEGGFAYFPGLSRPAMINSEDLPRAEAQHLEQLVQAAHSTHEESHSMSGRADYQSYSIRIETEQESFTMRVADPAPDPSLQALLDYLRDKTREQMMAKRKQRKP